MRESGRRVFLRGLLMAAALGAPGAAAAQSPGDGVKVVLQVSEGTKQAKLALYMAKRDLDLDPAAGLVQTSEIRLVAVNVALRRDGRKAAA